MSWNYRIVKYRQDEDIFYRISEIYYFSDWTEEQDKKVLAYLNTLENGLDYVQIYLWSESLRNAVSDYDSAEDLILNLELMRLAKDKPILDSEILNKIAEIRFTNND